jgi:hypothetical protein
MPENKEIKVSPYMTGLIQEMEWAYQKGKLDQYIHNMQVAASSFLDDHSLYGQLLEKKLDENKPLEDSDYIEFAKLAEEVFLPKLKKYL